ncbi:hypothetical protein DFH11DRAFT_1741039 [Phellopilus nigrolimitatus]|nr:hypothetical protein DFH11DRAFT_1741039 [Phellopilus nigrolimitatus]
MPGRYAFATLITSDSYLLGALIMTAALNEVHPLPPQKSLSKLLNDQGEDCRGASLAWMARYIQRRDDVTPGEDKFNEIMNLMKIVGSWDGTDQMLLLVMIRSLALPPAPHPSSLFPLPDYIPISLFNEDFHSDVGFGFFFPAIPTQRNVDNNTRIEAAASVAPGAASQPTEEEPYENQGQGIPLPPNRRNTRGRDQIPVLCPSQISIFREEATLPLPCLKRPRSEEPPHPSAVIPQKKPRGKATGSSIAQHANARRSKRLLQRRL